MTTRALRDLCSVLGCATDSLCELVKSLPLSVPQFPLCKAGVVTLTVPVWIVSSLGKRTCVTGYVQHLAQSGHDLSLGLWVQWRIICGANRACAPGPRNNGSPGALSPSACPALQSGSRVGARGLVPLCLPSAPAAPWQDHQAGGQSEANPCALTPLPLSRKECRTGRASSCTLTPFPQQACHGRERLEAEGVGWGLHLLWARGPTKP